MLFLGLVYGLTTRLLFYKEWSYTLVLEHPGQQRWWVVISFSCGLRTWVSRNLTNLATEDLVQQDYLDLDLP